MAEDGKDNSEKLRDEFIQLGFEVKEFYKHNGTSAFKNVKEAAGWWIYIHTVYYRLEVGPE